ncbi:hypothetical protein, partial [Siminovitchia fortis]|uniref:hypothetical protein n=1 Tax=Siminovitchia fortis TaxID=254758 RepID=UPI001C92C374
MLFVVWMMDVYEGGIVGYEKGLRCRGKDGMEGVEEGLLRGEELSGERKGVMGRENGGEFVWDGFEEFWE